MIRMACYLHRTLYRHGSETQHLPYLLTSGNGFQGAICFVLLFVSETVTDQPLGSHGACQ